MPVYPIGKPEALPERLTKPLTGVGLEVVCEVREFLYENRWQQQPLGYYYFWQGQPIREEDAPKLEPKIKSAKFYTVISPAV
jgi:hypothetical protein